MKEGSCGMVVILICMALQRMCSFCIFSFMYLLTYYSHPMVSFRGVCTCHGNDHIVLIPHIVSSSRNYTYIYWVVPWEKAERERRKLH